MHQAIHDLRSHTNPTRARTADEEHLLSQCFALFGGRDQTTQCHCACTLNVIVETRNAVTVTLEHIKRSGFTKVFPLQHGFWEAFFKRADKGINHFKILRAARAGLTYA